MTDQINNTENLKFYSQRSIGIATFIGGPLAAGYLIRENYLSLEESENGKNALLISIATTILLFCGIYAIPESMIDSIPNQIFPAVYTIIIYFIVEKIHGNMLKQHKENGNAFYSGWKATGIGLISLIIILIGIFGFEYLTTDKEVYDNYDKELMVFSQNEDESQKFYDDIDTKSRIWLIKNLENSIIPKWKENLEIIERTNAYENLPQELEEQNRILTEYSNLRIETFEKLKKAIQEDTDKYANELDALHLKMEQVLARLK